MEKCNVIQIKPVGPNVTPHDVRGIGYAIQGEAKKAGASCLAWWKDGVLTIAIQDMSPSMVARLATDFTRFVTGDGKAIEIIQRDEIPVPGGRLAESNLNPHALIRQKLTRKLLFDLPEGAFVVSNCFKGSHSSFAEQLGSAETRSQAWLRAVEARAAGRLCQVVWTESEFLAASCHQGVTPSPPEDDAPRRFAPD